MRKHKLNTAEKAKVVQLSRAGLRATRIALEMGLTRNTVMKWRSAAGLPGGPVLPEAKILSLLRRGVGARTIGRRLRVSYRAITKLARANGFGPVRPPRVVTDVQILSLTSDILTREASAAQLSRKHQVSYKFVLQLAHKILACERFLPSWKNPLSSYLPSKEPLRIMQKILPEPAPFTLSTPPMQSELEAKVLQLVDVVCRNFFIDERYMERGLPHPDCTDAFVRGLSDAMIATFRPVPLSDELWGCPIVGLRPYLETQLKSAIDTLRLNAEAQWKQ
jgi:hypothetical protein